MTFTQERGGYPEAQVLPVSYGTFQIEIENAKEEKAKYESEHTRITVSYGHHAGPINSVSGLGATQARRTEKGRHARHEDGHDQDDAIAPSQVDDGLHEEHVRIRHNTSRSGNEPTGVGR